MHAYGPIRIQPFLYRVPGRAAAVRALVAGSALAFATTVHAQAIPATAPTANGAPVPTAPAKASAPAGHADVSCERGRLQVVANGSSLNQILGEAASKCAFTVHGGVQEERVYGTYGPAPVGEVLTTLLEGTGVNMLLRQSSDRAASELLLTMRNGKPTPPGPPSVASIYEPPPPQVQEVQSNPAPPPVDQPNPPAALPPPASDTSQPTDGTPASTDGQSSNGVKTPQEIFNQLMKLQAQPAAPQPH